MEGGWEDNLFLSKRSGPSGYLITGSGMGLGVGGSFLFLGTPFLGHMYLRFSLLVDVHRSRYLIYQ